ncbi:MAG: VOC family protein [Bryobacteraceae bacterium]|jgi:predicted 3-demethylubiquinone-9 3-methyltransferase (glyoxalase superfamily)
MSKSLQKITPFLWFDHEAEEAARFYCSVFANSRIETITRYGDAGPGPKGGAMTVAFELDGQKFVALNGGPAFKFTEAVSFVVNCESQHEVDEMWERLLDGGQEIDCGWLKDKYGLAWQIVPTVLFEMLADQDAERKERVMRAMFQMKKLDIAGLEAAYRQPSPSA